MSFIGVLGGLAMILFFSCLGFYLGVTFNSRRYWDGYSRGYATAEADLNGLNGTVVRVEE
jgi:hypothetical protein